MNFRSVLVFSIMHNSINVMFCGTEYKFHSGLRHERFKRRESMQEQRSREDLTGLPSTKNKMVTKNRILTIKQQHITYNADCD